MHISRNVIFAERLTTAITEMSPAIHDVPWKCESKRTVDLLCLAKFLLCFARQKKISWNLRKKKQREKRYHGEVDRLWVRATRPTTFPQRDIKSLSSPSRFPEKEVALERRKTRFLGVGKFYVAGRVCGHLKPSHELLLAQSFNFNHLS